MLWPWFERVSSYGSVYEVEIKCESPAAKLCFYFSERARLGVPCWESAGSDALDRGDGKRSSSCSICLAGPGEPIRWFHGLFGFVGTGGIVEKIPADADFFNKIVILCFHFRCTMQCMISMIIKYNHAQCLRCFYFRCTPISSKPSSLDLQTMTLSFISNKNSSSFKIDYKWAQYRYDKLFKNVKYLNI